MMAPHSGRISPLIPENVRQAAILILLFPVADKIQTVFISRALHHSDVHSGQVSFPGGQLELQDAHLEACAVRETQEEIGVEVSGQNIIGRLSPLYIPVSNFLVTPIMASIPYTPEFVPDRLEVESILPVPMTHLLDAENLGMMDMELSSGRKVTNVPYFMVEERTIWGATAMILSECLHLVREL